MLLDLPTLMIAGAFVGALCAAFLLYSWLLHRQGVLFWWAASSLSLGVGVALLTVGFVDAANPVFLGGLTLLLFAPMLKWLGVRSFEGKPLRWLPVVIGLLVWFTAVATFPLHQLSFLPNIVNTSVSVLFLAATGYEIVVQRSDRLQARVPIAVLIAVHALALMLAIPASLSGGLETFGPPPIASLFGIIHFETIVYLVGTTIFVVQMVKERSERKHLLDAQTDALTGLTNRRAFLPMAERAAERCRRQGQPYAVVVFDLDRFKLVNDTYGHASGDEVLRIFAKVAREALRPGDIVSRAGGEEFYAILPSASLKDGCVTADRVRAAFENADISVGGREIKATVSAGVMASEDGAASLAALLEQADAALYRAKLSGRNCVQCGLKEAAEPTDGETERSYSHLVRVA